MRETEPAPHQFNRKHAPNAPLRGEPELPRAASRCVCTAAGVASGSVVEVSPITAEVEDKERALRADLAAYPAVVVAYSGGVDSAYLAWVTHDVLRDRAVALTARSASLMAAELAEAIRLAHAIGISHRIVDTREIDRPGYVANDIGRCYHCKAELFDAASLVAHAEGAVVVDGFNADDLSDHRPGHRAAAERRVLHPLARAGLVKSEIRGLSRRQGLPTWNKPQLACLASRLPYGMEVTEERLSRVERVEMALRREGFFDVRARLIKGNDEVVRIEVGEGELARFADAELRTRVVSEARAAGFQFVTLDLEGFRSGRLNEGLVQLRSR